MINVSNFILRSLEKYVEQIQKPKRCNSLKQGLFLIIFKHVVEKKGLREEISWDGTNFYSTTSDDGAPMELNTHERRTKTERENEKQLNLMPDFIRTECSMKETILKNVHEDRDCVQHSNVKDNEKKGGKGKEEETITYQVPSTEAIVHSETSMNFVIRYCSKLPKDNLRLPPNAPIQQLITSPLSSNENIAKQLANLEACKQLHQVGALNDNLLSVINAGPEEEEIKNLKKLCSEGNGTTKEKEMHEAFKAKALVGNWSEESQEAKLQIYKLMLTPHDPNCQTLYSNIVILIETKLADDVANAQFDLYLKENEVVQAKFNPCGEVKLNTTQIKNAMNFQEIIFNGIFNKNKAIPQLQKEERSRKSSWESSNMYLVLPSKLDFESVSETQANIDWKSITKCVDTVKSFADEEIIMHNKSNENINFANGIVPASNLINKAVLTIHNGRIHHMADIIYDKNADYSEAKHGKKFKYLKQPLLQAKETQRAYNLLTSQTGSVKVSGEEVPQKPANSIELPPELCIFLDIPGSFVSSVYLIPSVMYRMHSLMLASQLRDEIPECPSMDAMTILKALTSIRCNESFHYESLEFLGDAVLKYAVSCRLFLIYPKKHEGQLSAIRSLQVCNATLHALATRHKIPGYIRDEPFNLGVWAAPGSLPKKSIPCTCNADLSNNIVGKTCGKGHRWMCSKTIADVAEALIGAYSNVDEDLTVTNKFMSWMGILVDYNKQDVESYLTYQKKCIDPDILGSININLLEGILDYHFKNKTLLVEAITHPSKCDSSGGACYQRLEYLGDAVLDLLITQHLVEKNPDEREGFLTDLRQAAVNNKFFAYVSARHDLYQYLRYDSSTLEIEIAQFVGAVKKHEAEKKHPAALREQAPVVLGDLLEAIAGAILVDSDFDYQLVWSKMKDFLSPIVTPETLSLHPIREATELCNLKGFKYKIDCKTNANLVHEVIFQVALEDCEIIGKGTRRNKKYARREAAQQILMEIQQRGICHPRSRVLTITTDNPQGATKQTVEENTYTVGIDLTPKKKLDVDESAGNKRKKSRSTDIQVNVEGTIQQNPNSQETESRKPIISTNKGMLEENQSHEFRKKTRSETFTDSETAEKIPHDREQERGQARVFLNELSQKCNWKTCPEYEFVVEGLPHNQRFRAILVVKTHNGEFKIQGELKGDKKSAKDSAALLMLEELKKHEYNK